MSEYGGWSVSTGAVPWTRRSCSTLKLETPMWRVSPSSRSSTSAAQPSSICSSGIGQWIWYRSTASRPRRARLAFELAPEPVARQVVERRAARPLGLPTLGEDERPLVESCDRATDDLLRVAEAVLGRGVDPVHAELERAVDRRDRVLVLLRAPAPFEAAAADRPGAEADTRDLHPGRAELRRLERFLRDLVHLTHRAVLTAPRLLSGIVWACGGVDREQPQRARTPTGSRAGTGTSRPRARSGESATPR